LTLFIGPIHTAWMDVHITLGGRGDLSARIHHQLLDAIVDGRLRPGERLPPTRELARRVGVSRNTVAVAYERLAAEGVLTGRVGAGTFVCAEAIRSVRTRHAPAGTGVHPRLWKIPPVPVTSAQSSTPSHDFRVGCPDARLFPFTTWRRLVAREIRPGAFDWARYGDPGGHAGLREAIARHIGVSRSVTAHADDVIVTNGAQQAFDLIGRVLIEPGASVAVEDPGYPPVRRLFRSLGARVVGVPVDDEGLVVTAIPKAATLIYVTPSHQFPLGTPMSLQRRTALLEWADRRRAVVIEDDYDSEFRFEGRPLDPLQRLDRSGRVIYVGSFSKVMLPTLRLGFMIAPASLQPALRAAKRLSDWHGELPMQAALARFINDGLLARHIRKVAREYAMRHAKIVEAIRFGFGRRLRAVPSIAGLHVTGEVAAGISLDVGEIVRRAGMEGIFVHSLAEFSAGHTHRSGLVVGYGAIPTATIDEGLRRLSQCVRKHPELRRHHSRRTASRTSFVPI
jgi:GntR family transcriptional regulator / MocR family aminotransferase